MKKAILLILLLPMLASAQYFDVFDIDTSEYPIMKAKFYSIDANGKQILNHTTADFEITENGEPRDVISVSCPEPIDIPISVGIMVDTKIYINLARHGSERLVNLLKMPQNELAITYMNQRPLLFQDFTKLKARAIENSKTIPDAPGGTKVSEMFFDDFAGGVNIIKNRKAQNRVLVFISDLHCPNLDIDEQKLFQEARDNNIRVYTVLIGTADYTGLFGRIAAETNGVLFENVRDSIEIEDVFARITYIEQNEPCEISWEGDTTCEKLIGVSIFNSIISKSDLNKYLKSANQIVSLEMNSYSINFSQLNKDEFKDSTIILTAKNFEQVILSVQFEPNNGYFEVLNPLPIVMLKDKAVEINIRYTAIDTLKQYSRMTLTTDYCDFSFRLLAGSKNGVISQKTLELTHPNGGEVFIAGSDTVITWEGISENENMSIEFSSNSGYTWESIGITNNALNYVWDVPHINSDSCLVNISQLTNDTTKLNELIWSKVIGFTSRNSFQFRTLEQTIDGGFILGVTSGLWGNETIVDEGPGNMRLMKFDINDNIEWTKLYGGSELDLLKSICPTSDGGYIILGDTESSDFHATNNEGELDYLIIKTDFYGVPEWTKSIGGPKEELGASIIQSFDGGFTFAGSSNSFDREGTNSISDKDIWVYKLSPKGDLLWSSSIVGNYFDQAYSIIQTKDSGFVVLSHTNSSDLTEKRDNTVEILVSKLDIKGNVIWNRIYGGNSQEISKSIIETKDGGLIIAGYTSSDDNDITLNKGSADIWILKLNDVGDIEWSRTYGGSRFDDAFSIKQKSDLSYIVVGMTSSEDGDLNYISKRTTSGDAVILNIDPFGDLLWSKAYGGTKSDFPYSHIITKNNDIIVAAYSDSKDGDVKDDFGNEDIWLFKVASPMSPLQSDTSDAVFSIIMPEPVIQNNDIDKGQMIVGSTKDTIVSSVICNVGDAPLHVLGVDITDAFNSEDFLIPRGAGDFYLNKDECQDMMFEFTPSSLGNRTAVATIRTTIGDFKDTIHIRGVGIDPVIEVTSEVVDFGVFELGNGKDTTLFLVKNVGSTDITITDTRISGPDMEQFILKTSPLSYTISAGQEKEFKLNYTAKLGGKSNSFLDFHYEGIGSPIRSLLFAEGIGGEVYPVVADAYVGETVNLNLFLGKIKPEGLKEVATNFTATVSYNSTLLAPIDKSITVSTEDNKSYIQIADKLSAANQIATIPMKVGLGTDDRSGLVITEFQLYNANGDSVDYDIEPGVGEFKVLGICEEGGKRLINPNGEAVEMQVVPESNSGNAHIHLTLIETGQTELEIYDQIGNKVETVYSGIPSAGSQEINLDLSKYANGRYYIKLTTPTITKTEIIEVVR